MKHTWLVILGSLVAGCTEEIKPIPARTAADEVADALDRQARMFDPPTCIAVWIKGGRVVGKKVSKNIITGELTVTKQDGRVLTIPKYDVIKNGVDCD